MNKTTVTKLPEVTSINGYQRYKKLNDLAQAKAMKERGIKWKILFSYYKITTWKS